MMERGSWVERKERVAVVWVVLFVCFACYWVGWLVGSFVGCGCSRCGMSLVYMRICIAPALVCSVCWLVNIKGT